MDRDLSRDEREVFKSLLSRVQSPGQYVGGEWNSITKDHRNASLTFALAFPDTYPIGMSHLGMQILYHILNRESDILAERVFAPWLDMETLLREKHLPLLSIETRTPLGRFDVLGFSLQYELSFTNVLNMLELAGIPLMSCDRMETDPLVVAGGPVTFSPEPMADFIDLFFIGDAEENLIPFCRKLIDLKSRRTPRQQILKELVTSLPGLYAPSLYQVHYLDDGTIDGICPIEEGIPRVVEGQMVALERAPFPDSPIVPSVETVHDRMAIEIMRGCAGACRFCQAGATKGPVRFRSPETILRLAETIYRNTGLDEISLVSLSSSNYPHLVELASKLNSYFAPKGVGISLPSLRVDEKIAQIPALVSAVRKAGLTLAPEAASQRLQRVIRKEMCEDTLMAALEEARRLGWRALKLYFMVGLPTETMEDVEAIGHLVKRALAFRRAPVGAPIQLNVAVSSFIPKALTPFQWEPMAERPYLEEAHALLRRMLPRGRVRLKTQGLRMSFLEAVFSRGDRRLSKVLLLAHEAHSRFDAWHDQFDFTKWQAAFDRSGLDPSFYASRRRPLDEVFPWSHLRAGSSPEALRREYERSLEDAKAS